MRRLWGSLALLCLSTTALELLAVVLTVPAHRPNRDAIRKGWGKPSSFDVALWFVVSSRDADFSAADFITERNTFDDVVVCDVPSGFNRIIHKVSCALALAVKQLDFDYVIKTDDDATLCLGQIIKDLRAAPHDAALYAGRKLKFRRPLAEGKPLRANLGLVHDPPHFGGHGYAVSRDAAASVVAAFETGALYHHLHEDTNFGLWMLGLDAKRVNLRAMADNYFPNQKNMKSVVDPAQAARCEALMANRFADSNASWDLYACGMKQLPRDVPPHCSSVPGAAAHAPRPSKPRRGAPAPAEAAPLVLVVLTGACPQTGEFRCFAAPPGPGAAAAALAGLRAAVDAVRADYVAILADGAAAACAPALAAELAARASPKPLYGGSAVASDAPLLPALDRAAGLARAPTHATGAAVLSASLAAYLAAQTSPPLALEREPGGADVAFQLLGLWLAPFDADRRALASLSADACPGVVVR